MLFPVLLLVLLVLLVLLTLLVDARFPSRNRKVSTAGDTRVENGDVGVDRRGDGHVRAGREGNANAEDSGPHDLTLRLDPAVVRDLSNQTGGPCFLDRRGWHRGGKAGKDLFVDMGG